MCNIYKAHYSQFNMLWRAMYEKQCAMHTLNDCFVNECDPWVLFVFATVESTFTTYKGCQLKTNENYLLIQFTFDTLVSG